MTLLVSIAQLEPNAMRNQEGPAWLLPESGCAERMHGFTPTGTPPRVGDTLPATECRSATDGPRLRFPCRWLALCSLLTFLLTGLADDFERQVWSSGHGDVGLTYSDGQWSFTVRNAAPDEILVQGGASARLMIPPNPDFSFLGQPGDPIWILPQSQVSELPFLGLNAEGVPPGLFLGERVWLRLEAVIGPGDFILWTAGSGTVDVLMNARDGIAAEDWVSLPVLGHTHQNWGFTEAGRYELEFTATGTFTNGEPAPVSDPVRVMFDLLSADAPVAPQLQTSGHAELQVVLEEGVWRLELSRTDPPSVNHPHEVEFEVGESMSRIVPDDPRFAFLGQPGERVWILPQLPQPDAISLFVSGARIEDGAIVTDSAQLQLVEVRGPGDVLAYQVQPDGTPVLWLNSLANSNAAGGIPLSSVDPTPVTWAFTQAGRYEVIVLAVAERAGSEEPVRTAARILAIDVLPPSPAPPMLRLTATSPDGVVLRWNSDFGADYQVESAAAIQGPWIEVGEPHAGTGGELEQTMTSITGPHRFFRVRVFGNP
jgi:surface-anchored protein